MDLAKLLNREGLSINVGVNMSDASAEGLKYQCRMKMGGGRPKIHVLYHFCSYKD